MNSVCCEYVSAVKKYNESRRLDGMTSFIVRLQAVGWYSKFEGRVYLPRHGAHKARKVRWITRDGANNS